MSRAVTTGLLIALGLSAGAAPYLLPSFLVNLLSEVMIFGLLAMSINLLAGYTGLTPLGHAAIFGTATYGVGYFLVKAQQGHLFAFVIGIAIAIAVSALFALLAVRTSGVYFLMITIAEGMLVWGLAYRWTSVTGAENGLRGITRPGAFAEYWQFYYVVLAAFVILAWLMYRIIQSPFGLTLRGIRESETRMRALGYHVTLHKWLGFVVSSAFASVAGAIYAFYNQFVSVATVDFARSAEGLLMTVLGGVGTLFGPVIGAFIIIFTRNLVSLYTDRWPIVMGTIFVLTMLTAPDGLVGAARRLYAFTLRPRRDRPAAAPGRGNEVVERSQIQSVSTGTDTTVR